jgi:Zn finger protein HypA/HybF involved in hydrogenase expression
MKIKWIEEKETLEKLINEGVSYEFIGRKYGVSGNAVKKAAKRLGIGLTQKRSINPNEHFNRGKRSKEIYCQYCGKKLENVQSKFCDLKCQHEYYYQKYIERWKNGEENGLKGEYSISQHIKRYLFEKHNNKCEKCGWGETNEFTGTIPLEVHHMDGDYTNNKEENLQLLCPNCHSLTETHKSHNKKGRQGRKKYYK